ncbi:MAG: DUF2236 domain-containing protein [Polyangiaceae bacterium]|nr:DUF2236 domain-containing protein [Polyangiaceae bacterium]
MRNVQSSPLATAPAAHPKRAAPLRARPFEKTQAKTPVWQRLLLGRDISPTRAEFDAVLDGLWDGDSEMDALVEWMFSFGFRPARALFDRAIEVGIDNVPDAPEALRRFFAVVEREPAWLDRAAISDGIRFLHGAGAAGPAVLRDLALMGGYLLTGFNHALVQTGALNGSTSRRVAETGKWWLDCTEHGGLERFGAGFATTLQVRLVHALVRRGLSNKAEWEHERWGLPLNQVDMAATYLGFCVVLLGGVRKLGIPVTARESRGVMQLFRYACWLMGVEERWLVDTEREGIVLLHHCVLTQGRPDWTTRELAAALANEPLERQFSKFATIRRRFDYERHLSTTHYFLGAEKTSDLGLRATNGWYPLVTLMPRFLSYTGQRFVPAFRSRNEARGRRKQKALIDSVLGHRPESVIQPEQNHPAYVA